MLSKFLNSARDLLGPRSKPQSVATNHKSTEGATMVTTRSHSSSKSANESPQEESPIALSQTGSGRKRRRSPVRDVESPRNSKVETPSSSKRQKKLPVRSREEAQPSPRSRIVIEIPARKPELSSILDGTTEENSDSDQEDVIKAQLPTKHEILDSADESEDGISEVSQDDTKSKEEEESSDDDDAPEEVVTQDALKSVKSKERDAAKAVEEQQLAERKKRKEKDARLKKQAELANKKRSKQTQVKGSDHPLSENELESEQSPQAESEDETYEPDGDKSASTLTSRKRKDLPFYLPEELLEDDEEEEEATMELDVVREVKKPKKIKFTELVEKKPKDKRVGSTIYRVSGGVTNAGLAPKATQQARSTKEQWLKGRSGKAVGAQRKPFKSGFFVSGKKSTQIRRP
ncbi:hypothetical protein F5884DRAFT_711706 [Xylogone sp. PMI_703]|nr:hypothetical protein F5884DRAFT_711706 [Xylogone sp. PMI_703]